MKEWASWESTLSLQLLTKKVDIKASKLVHQKFCGIKFFSQLRKVLAEVEQIRKYQITSMVYVHTRHAKHVIEAASNPTMEKTW